MKGRTVSFIKNEESRSARYRCEYPEKERKKREIQAREAFTLLNLIKPIAADLKLLQYKVFVIDLLP